MFTKVVDSANYQMPDVGIVVIDNGNVTLRHGTAYIHSANGRFLIELGNIYPRMKFVSLAVRGENERIGNPAGCALEDKVHCQFLEISPRAGLLSRLHGKFRAAIGLFGIVQRSEFVYAFYPGSLPYLACVFALLLGKPYALYVRGERMGSWLSRYIIAKSRFILAAGSLLAEHCRELCPTVEEVVPMTDVFEKDLTPISDCRNDSTLNVLFVGRCEERKGIYELLEAASILKHRKSELRFTLIGAFDDTVRARVKEYELEDSVRLVGVVSDPLELDRYYREADIFCFPSHDEGFPRVLYEAMAHRLPIVTTFVGSIGSLMKDNVNCLEIEVNSSKSILEALSQLADKREFRVSLAHSSHDTFCALKEKHLHNSHAMQVRHNLSIH